MTRYKLVCAGAAALAISCSAAAQNYFEEDFEQNYNLAVHPEWSFANVVDGSTRIVDPPVGAPVSPTHFLGEFGVNDAIQLTLDLPDNVSTVSILFDAYLLRTWDGADVQFAGPDTFGYNIVGHTPRILDKTFSNGLGKQDFCPGQADGTTCDPATGSDLTKKNQLGFVVELDPVPGINGPAKGTPMSLVYHFDSHPIAYSGDSVTFEFFGAGLQPNVLDESWGIDNIFVNITTIPEPGLPILMLSGLAMLAGARSLARQRRQTQISRA